MRVTLSHYKNLQAFYYNHEIHFTYIPTSVTTPKYSKNINKFILCLCCIKWVKNYFKIYLNNNKQVFIWKTGNDSRNIKFHRIMKYYNTKLNKIFPKGNFSISFITNCNIIFLLQPLSNTHRLLQNVYITIEKVN